MIEPKKSLEPEVQKPALIAPEIKPKKPIVTPEERAKQKLANTLFSGAKPKEAPKAQTATAGSKKEIPPPKNDDSLI